MKNNKIISSLLISALIIGFIPTISNADNKGQNPNRNDDYRNSTSTMMKNKATSTKPMKGNMLGIGGVISGVASSSFTINNIGKNNATTTYTVNVASTTTYKSGTTTISLASLAVGQHVMVQGELSTTTKTISAKNVTVVDPNMKNRDVRKEMFASSTNPNANGMFHKMLNWFRNKFR